MFATRALEQLAMGTEANEEDEVREREEGGKERERVCVCVWRIK